MLEYSIAKLSMANCKSDLNSLTDSLADESLGIGGGYGIKSLIEGYISVINGTMGGLVDKVSKT